MRGALMLTISIDHPDSEEFIDMKMDTTKVTGANVSVKVTDAFMEAVRNNQSYTQQWPVGSENPKVTKVIDAKSLWNKMMFNAWKSAEPGVLYWDTVKREAIPDCYSHEGFDTVSVNPCGEILLNSGDSCRLLAINLLGFVKSPFSSEAHLDWGSFKNKIRLAMRLMDGIVDLELEKHDAIISKIESDPEPNETKEIELNLWKRIKSFALKGRRSGLGITAMGDMLAALGLKYGTKEATDFAAKVHQIICLEAYRSSVEMAEERGAFPIYDASREVDNPMINRIKNVDPALYDRMTKSGRRNIALLTIAPTGTVSMMTQTTSGIEPCFMPYYMRRTKVNPNDPVARIDFVDEVGDAWEENNVFHHGLLKWAKVNGHDIENLRGDELAEVVARSPYHGATANDVDWVEKVRMQGAIQKWVDHSISVTVNVPKETPESLVSEIYMTGWESGCKGMTIYRDGSRSGVLVSTEEKKDTEKFTDNHAIKRPEKLEGDVLHFKVGERKWVAIVGKLDGRPYEIFSGRNETAEDGEGLNIPEEITKGFIRKRANGNNKYFLEVPEIDYRSQDLAKEFNPNHWGFGKMISGLLRHGMPIQYVVDSVEALDLKGGLFSWKSAIVRALKAYITDGTEGKGCCSECGADALVYQEGCLTCKSCGYAKCG